MKIYVIYKWLFCFRKNVLRMKFFLFSHFLLNHRHRQTGVLIWMNKNGLFVADDLVFGWCAVIDKANFSCQFQSPFLTSWTIKNKFCVHSSVYLSQFAFKIMNSIMIIITLCDNFQRLRIEMIERRTYRTWNQITERKIYNFFFQSNHKNWSIDPSALSISCNFHINNNWCDCVRQEIAKLIPNCAVLRRSFLARSMH